MTRRLTDHQREARWKRIRASFHRHASLLSRSGRFTAKRSGTKLLRYVRFHEYLEGRRIQHAIYVGDDPTLILRVERLLAFYRSPSNWSKQLTHHSRALESIVLALRRPDRRRECGEP